MDVTTYVTTESNAKIAPFGAILVSDCVDTSYWCGKGDSNPHDVATASPSSWCVCQFRHFRDNKEVGVLEPAATVARNLLASSRPALQRVPQPVRLGRRVR